MSKIAVIATGGKQYKVRAGQALRVEKLDGQVNDQIKLDTLLIADADSGETQIGQPSLGAQVSAKIVEQGKADKVLVVKFKNKIRYKRTRGHRQQFTKISIDSIA